MNRLTLAFGRSGGRAFTFVWPLFFVLVDRCYGIGVLDMANLALTVVAPRTVAQTELARTIAAIALASLILMIPVIMNGFPFIFPDSADYLICTPRYYFRSPFYGIWICFFHLYQFIWGPVVAQAVVGSHLLYLLFRTIHVPRLHLNLLLSATLLAAFSSLPYFVGFIMPDIFTSYMAILLYLLGFQLTALFPMERVYVLLLACVAVASHLSHLTLATLMVALFVPVAYWAGYAWKSICQRTSILLLPAILTCAAYLTFNVFVLHTFALSPAGPTFFLANLIEYGPAREYLHAACPQAGYKICSEAATLPKTANDFLWHDDFLGRLGGFAGMAKESDRVVSDTIATRPWEIVTMSADNFLESLNTHEPAKELTPTYIPAWTPMFTVLDQKFGPRTVEEFRDSAQMKGTIPHTAIASIDRISTPLAFVVLAVLTVYVAMRGQRDLAAFAIFMCGGIFLDAWLCATLAGVYDRYQARMTWLLPMAAFAIAVTLKGRLRRLNSASPSRPVARAGA